MRRGAPLASLPLALLAACAADPVLLSPNDLDGVAVQVEQNSADALAPGWTWCSFLSPGVNSSPPVRGSRFSLEGGAQVGASVLDRRDEGWSSDRLVERIESQADQCALEASDSLGTSIEPLDGLATGARGWRTADPEGRWGEYVVVKLDEWRVLAYGFATDDADPPVDLDDLGDLARTGSERFPLDG